MREGEGERMGDKCIHAACITCSLAGIHRHVYTVFKVARSRLSFDTFWLESLLMF